MIRPVPQAAFDLAKRFEGFLPRCQHEPNGHPVIGYGHDLILPDDNALLTAEITEGQAEALLARDMDDAATALLSWLNPPIIDLLTDNQYAALLDFVFNEGSGNFAKSTLRLRVLAGDEDAVATEFVRWVFAEVNGRKTELRGLLDRRTAERALYLTP